MLPSIATRMYLGIYHATANQTEGDVDIYATLLIRLFDLVAPLGAREKPIYPVISEKNQFIRLYQRNTNLSGYIREKPIYPVISEKFKFTSVRKGFMIENINNSNLMCMN